MKKNIFTIGEEIYIWIPMELYKKNCYYTFKKIKIKTISNELIINRNEIIINKQYNICHALKINDPKINLIKQLFNETE